MSLTSEEANKLFVAATLGNSAESTGLISKEHKAFYDQTLKEIKEAPKGIMAAPINDWVGDEYDDVIAMIERVQQQALAKSIGTYQLSKAEGDKRYTLGAMYIPDRLDAHSEWTDAEELQQAVWNYVRSGDRNIRLQHNREIVAGEWVEVMAFPYELTVPVQQADGTEQTHTYPPDTVFLGVIWEPWAWELVQSGKILGYSIGGKAERLYVDMESVEKVDGPTVSDVHSDAIINPQKKKKKTDLIQTEEMTMEKDGNSVSLDSVTQAVLAILEASNKNQPVFNVILPDEKQKVRRIERDENGNILRIIEE